jgi:predicted lipase
MHVWMSGCRVQSSTYDIVNMYTFGQPRVGNDAYETTYSQLVNEYRVVHYADIVPHLPPELLGFHHVPTEV